MLVFDFINSKQQQKCFIVYHLEVFSSYNHFCEIENKNWLTFTNKLSFNLKL